MHLHDKWTKLSTNKNDQYNKQITIINLYTLLKYPVRSCFNQSYTHNHMKVLK